MLWPLIAALGIVAANFDVSLDEKAYTASSTLEVSWEDDGSSPSEDSFSSAKFLLCSYIGGKFSCPITLGTGVDISKKSEASFDLSTVAAMGPPGAYVVQMVAIGSTPADYVINYGSSWASFTGFTGAGNAASGSLPGSSGSGGASASGAAGNLPDADAEVPSEYSNLASPWMTPYIYQHDITRYAPFQLTPNTSVTVPMTLTRRFSTSSVSIFTEWVKTPLPVTTVTPSPSITITLVPNSASSYHPAYTGRPASRVTPTAVYRQRRWAD